MKVKVDTDIIDQECFVIARSIMSDEITARKDKITGIMVDKDKKISLRMGNGQWLSADAVYTKNIDAEVLKRQQKYAPADKSPSEK